MWANVLLYTTYVPSLVEFWGGYFSSVVEFIWNDPLLKHIYGCKDIAEFVSLKIFNGSVLKSYMYAEVLITSEADS